MSEMLGKKAVKATLWASADRFISMALQFGVNIVLTRLLMPEAFGAVGYLEIFIAVSQVLIDGGFASALIQKKVPTQKDYSTIFYFNMGVAALLYVALFFASPLVASYYRLPLLVDLLRVLGLVLLTNALSVVQTNILRKTLNFRRLAIINLSAYVVAGGLTIVAASTGFGVWSLVVLQLGYSMLTAFFMWISGRWVPSPVFSRKSLKELFSFGGYLLSASVLQEICKNFQSLLIGRRFNATQMGLYTQAYKLDRISSYTIPNILVQVMYPVYSSIQDDNKRLAMTVASNARLIAFLIFPLMGLLILIAHPLVTFLYGRNWEACAPYFQILCVGGLFSCLQNINFYAVAAKGRSRSLFLWSFYKWGFLLAALFIGMIWGMAGLLWGMALSNLNIYIVNALLVQRFVGYPLFRQLLHIFPMAALTGGALGAGCLVSEALGWHIVAAAIIYAVVYLAAAFLLRLPELGEIKGLISRLIDR